MIAWPAGKDSIALYSPFIVEGIEIVNSSKDSHSNEVTVTMTYSGGKERVRRFNIGKDGSRYQEKAKSLFKSIQEGMEQHYWLIITSGSRSTSAKRGGPVGSGKGGQE